jgi:hypothetical protein
MSAHQCPRCPLTFSFRTEVEYHVATDHRTANVRPQTTDESDDADTDRRFDEPAVATARVRG